MSDINLRKWIKRAIAIAFIVILAIFTMQTVSGMVVTVPSGYRGILLNWGEPIAVLGEGFHLITPISQSVDMMSVQVQKAEAEEATASADLQEITTSMAVNYKLNEGYLLEIYKTLRNDYEPRVVRPAIEEGIKASTANFTTYELIQKRELVKIAFKENLEERLSLFRIEVIAVSITNFQFSPEFQAQVDKTAVAAQKALEEKNNLDIIYYQAQQKVIQAQADANATILAAQAFATQTILSAQGRANATVLSAHAEATAKLLVATSEAEAIRLFNEQLSTSPAYLTYTLYKSWNGQFPIYWFGNGTTPFVLLNLPTNSTLP